VVSTFASDPNSIALQLQSAQADMADEIGPVAASTLPKDDVKAQSEHLTPVLLMNTKDKALSDAAVRRAIGYAIDYGSILKSAYKGYGIVPNGALPTNSQNWAAPSQPYFTTDAAKAKSLLGAQAPASLSLTYPNDPSSTLTAQIIQQNLQEIGISVKLQSADAASAFATISGGGYQLGLFSYNAISPDVSDPLWYVAATKSMFTGRPADDLLASLAAYAATDDPKKKEAEVTKMQDVLFEDAPFLALAHTNAIEAQRAVVQGAGVTPWGTYYLDPVWKTK
jgi:peptide/nickel transport system substrate-binding protein